MSATLEKPRGSKPEEGRDYWLDFGDAFTGALAIDDNGSIKEDDDPDVEKWIDYLGNAFKGDLYDQSKDYDRVVLSLKSPRKGFDSTGRWQIGPIDAFKGPGFGLSLYDKDGQKMIASDDHQVGVNIHPIVFDSNVMMRPGMISSSLQILADGLAKTHNPPVIMGITHLRLARLSQRWGFEVAERPFAPRVYEFVDQLRANPELVEDDRARDAVVKAARQALVYQYTEEFIRQHHQTKGS